MDWIKKNVEQFALALLALLLLALAVLLFLKAQSFPEAFSEAKLNPPHSTEIAKVETGPILAAKKELTAPAQWNPPPDAGSLLVSKRMMKDTLDPSKIKIVGQGMTHPPIPDSWLDQYELDIISTTVLDEDPDKDGFTNIEEFRGADRSDANGEADATNPKDKNIHPPYYTKLFLQKWIRVPFRLLFNAYDGDPKKDPIAKINFQVNTLDLRQPSEFLNIGETVRNTRFKLVKFEYKTKKNESIGTEDDVSELTLENIDTKVEIILVYQKEINSPTYFAQFSYVWPTPPLVFGVKKGQEFVLKPNVQEKFKLIDVTETEAQIQLPGSDKTYTVPLLQNQSAPPAPVAPK